MLAILIFATAWLPFLILGRFHNFCQIVRTALHLALVPHMARVYSAAGVDRRRRIRFDGRPGVEELQWARAPSLKIPTEK